MLLRHIGGIAVAFLGSVTFAVGAAWADGLPEPIQPIRPWVWEVGARYWYSTGESQKNLYGPVGTAFSSTLFSRLTYDQLTAHTGEGFFRVDHNSGFFLKGYAGGGKVVDGNLTDEDFPPATVGYSNTTSEQRDGDLTYFDIDGGVTLINTRGHSGSIKDSYTPPGYRIGAFAGYHYWKEQVHAFGCVQNEPAQPDGICVPAFPTSVLGISQDNRFDSLRLGIGGDVDLTPRLTLSGEAAYVRTWLDGADTHHLRVPPACNMPNCFAGPLKEDGVGDGVQIEAILAYQLTEALSVGVGGRYWHLETDGLTHFRFLDGTSVDSPVKWEAERYGVFVQGGLKLN